MKKIYYFILLSIMFLTKVYSQNLEQEIINIKSNEALNQYWLNIKSLDQSYRGLNTVDSIDNVNYKKTILLIKNHGYPKGSIIPNIIATHQRSLYVNEFYFPIFYNAYKSGLADSIWFYHILRGIHRARFGRDLLRNRAITDLDVDTIIKRLLPILNKKVDFSIQKFDSLYNKYLSDLNEITSSRLVNKWKNSNEDSYFFYQYNDKLFYYKVWADGSSRFPQEIKFNQKLNHYEYLNIILDDYLTIRKDFSLEIFMNGELKEVVPVYQK